MVQRKQAQAAAMHIVQCTGSISMHILSIHNSGLVARTIEHYAIHLFNGIDAIILDNR